MSQQSVTSQYVDAAIKNLRQDDMLRCSDPNMPAEMRDPERSTRDGWLAWKPISSTVTDDDIFDLQAHFGGKLPPPYVALLKHVHFYDLTERGVRFQRHIVGEWKERMVDGYETYQQHFPSGSHLVPFGAETFMDAGPVCFDFNNRHPNGDCPIVFWDHEWVNTDKEIQPLFSSAQKMFESLLLVATSNIDFCYHDPDYDPAYILPQKQKLLAEFLAIDPNGAGGPARDYWTCWGVTPHDAK